MTVEDVIDGLLLVGFLAFPPYLLYWAIHHLGRRAYRRLWIGLLGFVGWCAATVGFFLFPMLSCMGGHCAGKVSPYLEFSIAYAATTLALIGVLHWLRAGRQPVSGKN